MRQARVWAAAEEHSASLRSIGVTDARLEGGSYVSESVHSRPAP